MKLDKNHVYSLEELTSEEYKTLYKWLLENDEGWEFVSFEFWKENKENLKYNGSCWAMYSVEPTNNAKELFYTLENVQVDCNGLTDEQVKEMADVFEANGYKVDEKRTNVSKHKFTFLRIDGDDVWCSNYDENKTTITYEKFMELFGPQYEVKMIVEAPNDFKQITDSIASLLQYKNEKYGNSALEPLNVFQGKCKVGQRLDDKLARVKNNDTLQKNDVADLIGYLFLVCKENEWNNFDEFKD